MQATIIARDQHPVSRKQMSPETIKVLYRLYRTGNLAYLCGGGVRDLYLGRDTADFDVVTDAKPNKVRTVFRNCRLVGRRFRIAHIMFKGGKIIEVATFRKMGEEEQTGEEGESLLIRRDNTFGSPAEDAFRRDYTVNALYYDIADFTIIDYVGGIEDLKRRLIRCVGDPDVRFQEDPIRILRGIRLAAFLDFQVEHQTWEAMKRQRHHIVKCAASRIREEIMKILRRGNVHQAFVMLQQAGILEILFPKLDEFLRACHENEDDLSDPFWKHLEVLETLRNQNATPPDPLLLAALTAIPTISSLEALSSSDDVGKWLYQYHEENFKSLAIPRIVRSQVHILHLALRHMLNPKRKKRRRSLRNSPLFPDALKLLEIHCRATQNHWPVLHHWKHPHPHSGNRRTRPKPRTPKRTP
jgi:poly(A) polymerase